MRVRPEARISLAFCLAGLATAVVNGVLFLLDNRPTH